MNNGRTTKTLIPKRCTDISTNTPRSPCNPCFNVECGNGSLRLRNLFLGNDVPRTYFASSIPNIETRGCRGNLIKGCNADTSAFLFICEIYSFTCISGEFELVILSCVEIIRSIADCVMPRELTCTALLRVCNTKLGYNAIVPSYMAASTPVCCGCPGYHMMRWHSTTKTMNSISARHRPNTPNV